MDKKKLAIAAGIAATSGLAAAAAVVACKKVHSKKDSEKYASYVADNIESYEEYDGQAPDETVFVSIKNNSLTCPNHPFSVNCRIETSKGSSSTARHSMFTFDKKKAALFGKLVEKIWREARPTKRVVPKDGIYGEIHFKNGVNVRVSGEEAEGLLLMDQDWFCKEIGEL